MATVCPVAPLHQEAITSRLNIKSVKSPAGSSTLTPIPSHRALTTATSGDQAVHPDHDDSIPVIDFSLLSSSDPDQRSKVVLDLAKACQEWGFFMVINHGIPESQMKAMMDMLTGFFDLTEEEKREFEGKHMSDPIRYGTSLNALGDKVFSRRDFLKVWVHPKFHCPTKPEAFSDVLADYSGAVRKLAKTLLEGISESLGFKPGYIHEVMSMDSGLQILAANLYPPCPQPELTMGVPPHADHGLLTILMQNGIGGLQVHHGGKWVKVDPLPNAFLVNTGDHLEIMSKGKYKSVLHRVMMNDKATRISIAVSNGPSPDTVVTPMKQLVDDKNSQAVHIGMKYKEYLQLHWSSRTDGKSSLDRVISNGLDGVFTGKLGLDGVLTGISNLDGVLTRKSGLDGVLTGSSGLDGVLTGKSGLDGVLTGKSGLDGVLMGISSLDGVLTGSSGLDGVLTGISSLDGVLTGKSSLDGVLTGISSLDGVLTGSSGLDGVLTGKSGLDGVLTGISSFDGVLTGKSSLDGVLTGIPSLDGVLPSGLDGVLMGKSGLDGVLVGNRAWMGS